MNLESLGITADDLRGQIVEKAVDRLMDGHGGFNIVSKLELQIEQEATRICDRIGAEMIEPKVSELIERLTFQKSNSWGESKEPAKTWREMLVERAESWLTEHVNYEGKTKNDDAYNWRPASTRIAYLVDKHMQYEIEKTMKEALLDANKAILKGIHEAVRIKLNELGAALKVTVTTN